MADAADPQELALRFEQAERQLQTLDRHLAYLEQSLREIQAALTAVEGLDGRAATDSLVPLGAGVRLRANVDPGAPLMVDVGAGYHVETDLATAKKRLQARLESTRSAYQATDREATSLVQSLESLRARLAQLAPSDD